MKQAGDKQGRGGQHSGFYSLQEERVNSWSHGIGVLFVILAAPLSFFQSIFGRRYGPCFEDLLLLFSSLISH